MSLPGSRPKIRARATWRGGFSLIEVVLALGVLSFAILPSIALIGGSLKSYRTAIDDTVSRQIMTQLAGNAQQARLSDLQAQPTATNYFDFEGNPVAKSSSMRIYTATVTNLPDTNSAILSSNLYRVQIAVTSLEAAAARQTSLRICPEN